MRPPVSRRAKPSGSGKRRSGRRTMTRGACGRRAPAAGRGGRFRPRAARAWPQASAAHVPLWFAAMSEPASPPSPASAAPHRADHPFRLPHRRESDKASLVGAVFNSVAARYDLMNDLMSGGVHRVWKAAMLDWLNPRPEQLLLDVGGGTGDIAFRFLDRGGGGVVVVDINREMLAVGRDRAIDRGLLRGLDWVCGDAERLPVADSSVDAFTIAFAIRNVTRIEAALREARRVLKPGGRFLCLEFSRVVPASPRSSVRHLFVPRAAGARPRGRPRCRRLPLSRRKHSPLSAAGAVCADDRSRRSRPGELAQPLGRHRRPAFRLAHLTMRQHRSTVRRRKPQVCSPA